MACTECTQFREREMRHQAVYSTTARNSRPLWDGTKFLLCIDCWSMITCPTFPLLGHTAPTLNPDVYPSAKQRESQGGSLPNHEPVLNRNKAVDRAEVVLGA